MSLEEGSGFQRGVARTYVRHLSGYSQAQATRLVARQGTAAQAVLARGGLFVQPPLYARRCRPVGRDGPGDGRAPRPGHVLRPVPDVTQ